MPPIQPLREWTVLVYMNSNNNLANGAKGLLRHQLAELDPGDGVGVAVEYSHLRGEPTYVWPAAATHKRCEVRPHELHTVEDMPYQNMAAPKTLEDFLRWGIGRYPAKHYAIILQGHGSAWRNSLPDDATRFEDGQQLPAASEALEGSLPASLSLPELNRTLEKVQNETGVVPDVLAFDSCLMSNLEAGCELQDRAAVLIGSEDVMSSPDWRRAEHTLDYAAPLKGILQKLADRVAAHEDVTARTFARDWVEECGKSWTTPTQTAFETAGLAKIAAAADGLAAALLPAEPAALRDLTEHARHFGLDRDRFDREWDSKRHLYDLVDLASQVQADPRLSAAHQAARDLVASVEAARIAHEAQPEINSVWRFAYGEPEPHPPAAYPAERTHGLSVYLPNNPEIQAHAREDGHDYDALRFARETRWPQLIQRINSGG